MHFAQICFIFFLSYRFLKWEINGSQGQYKFERQCFQMSATWGFDLPTRICNESNMRGAFWTGRAWRLWQGLA